MKVFVLFGLLVLLTSPAFAQTTVTSGSQSGANSTSGSTAGANNANQVGVNISSTAPERQSIASDSKTDYDANIKTNTPVGLTAATSFSSDYCGGVDSWGASGAGVSLGKSTIKMDPNCQALRRAEKIGMMAVTANNLGDRTTSARLKSLATWQLCVIDKTTQDACLKLGLVVDERLPDSENPGPVPQN